MIVGKSLRGNLRTFRTYRFDATISQNPSMQNTESFWVLRTNVRLKTLNQLIWLSLFYRISIDDLFDSMCLDIPFVLENDFVYSTLRVERQGKTPVTTLEFRIQSILQSFGKDTWSKNLLYTLLGDFKYELELHHVPIGKVIKYSGYVRSPSSVGSKSSKLPKGEIDYILREPSEEFDFFEFLSVGKIPLRGIFSSLTRPNEAETDAWFRHNLKRFKNAKLPW